jgi:putative DNA primase/helicase
MLTALTNDSAHVCTPKTPKEYLDSLPAWDGVKRLNTWLPHVMDETPAAAGMYRMEYLGLVGRYWLMGMARRATTPGFQLDYCPVLEGVGGFGKSTLLTALAGKEFFSDSPLDMPHRFSPEETHNLWIYEVCELSAFNKAEKEQIKALISANVDAYRAPFQSEITQTPRGFVMVGTTNETSYRRKDETRRWLPVPVRHQLNVQWVKDNRDQLFAEARLRIHSGECIPDLSAHPGMPRFGRRGGAA